MQIYYQQIKELPNYVAWIQCERENIDEIRKMFPKDEYEILVAVKANYDPLTCSTRVLYNPPASTWGIDVWKRETDGRCEGLSPEKD